MVENIVINEAVLGVEEFKEEYAGLNAVAKYDIYYRAAGRIYMAKLAYGALKNLTTEAVLEEGGDVVLKMIAGCLEDLKFVNERELNISFSPIYELYNLLARTTVAIFIAEVEEILAAATKAWEAAEDAYGLEDEHDQIWRHYTEAIVTTAIDLIVEAHPKLPKEALNAAFDDIAPFDE